MVDPISGAAVSGVANAVGSKVIEKIVKGENDHEEWQQRVIETATDAEAARRYYIESGRATGRKELAPQMERLGKQAQKLAVIGERQRYDADEIETVNELAQICSDYATAPKMNDDIPEKELSEQLPPLIEEIFGFVE